ncbi:hypothetical protein ACI1TU_07205 [Lactococcus garvieae]|uniref:hypothetical protein n=1 Tax=Lactococcus garvieae TaxID=1363 RepID=UPI003853BD26
MKIYELARELGVGREALLFFAQNQKIEVKSIAAELTSEEKDLLLLAFDEAGGKLEPVIPEGLITTGATGKEEVSGKQSNFKGFFSSLKKYEKKPKEPEIPKTKTVKEGKALRIYRLVVILIIGLFVGLGYSAYNANVQVTDLTQKVNETTQTLGENQKNLSKENEKLLERVKVLENGNKKSESTSKSTEKKASAPKAKTHGYVRNIYEISFASDNCCNVKIKSVNIKGERNLVLLFLYIGGRMNRTGITVDKKMIDVEGISNFYSIKISTAKNKFVKLKEANGSCKKIILE